jgi:two-component system sensor histidine kinase UhpB
MSNDNLELFPRHDPCLETIALTAPGVVYQFLLREDNSTAFPYLSRTCSTLLGMSASQLRANPGLFLNLVEPEDRPSYLETMAASAASMETWNWEGRLWIEKWQDIKWVSLRARPRLLPGHGVQWEGLMTNTTRGKKTELEIRRSRRKLAELSAHAEVVKEQERERISREIHDYLGGNLTGIKMALAQLRRRLPEGEELLVRADYVDALIDRTIEATHRIASELRPAVLDLGVVAAIQWQASEFALQAGIPCVVDSQAEDIELPSDQATGLFRIFQESLNNIAKHANATRVNVRLGCTQGGVNLAIADNGRGVAPGDRLKPGRFGIQGMMERAAALGGQLSVSVGPEGGCLVSAMMPRLAAASARRLANGAAR